MVAFMRSVCKLVCGLKALDGHILMLRWEQMAFQRSEQEYRITVRNDYSRLSVVFYDAPEELLGGGKG